MLPFGSLATSGTVILVAIGGRGGGGGGGAVCRWRDGVAMNGKDADGAVLVRCCLLCVSHP